MAIFKPTSNQITMQFTLHKSIEILHQTPLTLYALLSNLSNEWILQNEGENTWSPFDIIGHLIYGEKTDWMVRIKIILNNTSNTPFKPFDRFAQFKESKNKSIEELLQEFKTLRTENIKQLKALHLNKDHLKMKGYHPEFGEVTLEELLSTWVVHDLGHLAQISRVMAFQYKENVGPWQAYLPIVSK